MPTGFIPQQDQGRLIVNVQLSDAASLERCEETMKKVVEVAVNTPGVHAVVANGGLSFLLQANSPNFGAMFIVLKPFAERQGPGLRDVDIMEKLRRGWAELRTLEGGRYDCQVTVFGASAIPGIGTAGGFKFLVEDRGGVGVHALEEQMDGLVAKLKKIHGLRGVTTQFRANMPQYFLDIDRAKVADAGRIARRREPDAGHVPGIGLRQQLQRFRPPLAGHRSGRGQIPQSASRIINAVRRSATNRDRWCRSAR